MYQSCVLYSTSNLKKQIKQRPSRKDGFNKEARQRQSFGSFAIPCTHYRPPSGAYPEKERRARGPACAHANGSKGSDILTNVGIASLTGELFWVRRVMGWLWRVGRMGDFEFLMADDGWRMMDGGMRPRAKPLLTSLDAPLQPPLNPWQMTLK